jgi:hypothetical protein
VFNIITFGLFWFVYRYNTLYVTRFRLDTGGLFFPKAINQLFTGIYVMELCLIGLFFLERDSNGVVACKGQGICMIVVLILTGGYQIFLDEVISPLIRYLPTTLGKDAVPLDNGSIGAQSTRQSMTEGDYEQRRVNEREGKGWDPVSRSHDEENQNPPIGCTLFAGIHDELKDLEDEERNELVQRAFLHEALRAKRPVIWIPRDDLGVSDDEVGHTQAFSKYVSISNKHQYLDEKCSTIFDGNPPDFSEVDLIRL